VDKKISRRVTQKNADQKRLLGKVISYVL